MTHLPDSDLRELEGLVEKAGTAKWRFVPPTRIWTDKGAFVGQTINAELVVCCTCPPLPDCRSTRGEGEAGCCAEDGFYSCGPAHEQGNAGRVGKGADRPRPCPLLEHRRLPESPARIKELEGKT